MTITLPKGWGPGTVLTLLYVLFVCVAGVIEIAQGDMSLIEFLETTPAKSLAIVIPGLSIARGVTAIGSPESVLKGKGEVK